MSSPTTVLVVDDEVRSLEALRRVLQDEFEIICARNADEAEAVLAGELVQILLCDQRMPGESGVEFLKRARDLWPDTIRIIISGYTDSEDVIAGVNLAGIYRYVTKPWRPEELLEIMREAARISKLQREAGDVAMEVKPSGERLRNVIRERRHRESRLYEFDRIVHRPDSPIREALALGRQAARYDISVLITGASGTGKELLARAIHYSSGRAEKPFVVENCGALPDDLLESELFGCKKGAFTGAYQDRIGLFELADGGTIFLDEIGETSAAFQVKLLRVLQEGEIRPLGAQRPRKVSVRVISATNRDLAREVEAGRFRRDLYYRVAPFPIHMPTLAERADDVPMIAARILLNVNQAYVRHIPGFAPETLALMARYPWPGNVRELQNEIQRMVVLAENDAPLPSRLLSPEIRAPSVKGAAARDTRARPLREIVGEVERSAIADALARHSGNISHAAEELGLSRVGLRSKIERYDLRRDLDEAAE
jgi:two-component system response regulator HupR/HoxA